MQPSPKNVLFLCTGNSCRSIMAESLVNRLGRGHFRGHSAGSYPTGRLDPHALALLQRLNYPTGVLRSKDWTEFAAGGAPTMDFVFTVWPGQPISAHWGFPDPAAFEGGQAETAAFFAEVYGEIERRVSIFVGPPFDALDRLSLKRRLDELGRNLPQSA